MAISGKMPPVSYLTWLDQYTLWNFALIIVMALQSRCLTQTTKGTDLREGGLFDFVSLGILGSTWLSVHIWFIRRATKLWFFKGNKTRDKHLKSGRPMDSEYAKNKQSRGEKDPSSPSSTGGHTFRAHASFMKVTVRKPAAVENL